MRLARVKCHGHDSARYLAVHLLHAVHGLEGIHHLPHRILFGQAIHRQLGSLDGGFLGRAEIMGIAGSHHVKTKAAGINIDLWTGLGMLVFAALMLLWAFGRPTVPEPATSR